jgi:hypothetical protein
MSRSEALGITQLEFLSNGVPVVSSGTGGQKWIVKDGENGIVLGGPDDTDAAVEAIIKLVDNEQLRKTLGRNAVRSARRFSMTRLTHDLAKRLESLNRGHSDDETLRHGMEKDEEALEAMISGKMKVIVTNRRLLVKDDHDGGETISVPLEDISSITPHTRLSWRILAAGAVAAAVLVFSVLAPPVYSYLVNLVPRPAGELTPIDLVEGIDPGTEVERETEIKEKAVATDKPA